MKKIIIPLDLVPDNFIYVKEKIEKTGNVRDLKRLKKKLNKQNSTTKKEKFKPFTGIKKSNNIYNNYSSNNFHQETSASSVPPFLQNKNLEPQKIYKGEKTWFKNTTGGILIVDFGTYIEKSGGGHTRKGGKIIDNFIKINEFVRISNFTEDQLNHPKFKVLLDQRSLIPVTEEEALEGLRIIEMNKRKAPESLNKVGRSEGGSVSVGIMNSHRDTRSNDYSDMQIDSNTRIEDDNLNLANQLGIR